jgi:hypothetical protein
MSPGYDAATREEPPAMPERPRLDTTRLQKISLACWESAALMAAVELACFHRVSGRKPG